MAISPDVGSFIERQLGCGNLLRRNLIRNVARKASSVTLTTGMVATPSRRGWSVLRGYLPKNRTKSSVKRLVRRTMERAQHNIHKQAAGLIVTADGREIKDDFSVLLQGNRLAQDQRGRPTASPG